MTVTKIDSLGPRPEHGHVTKRTREQRGYYIVAARGTNGAIVAVRNVDYEDEAEWWSKSYAASGREVTVSFVPGTVDLPEGYNA
jgi:transcriptional regulator CtsR